MRSSTCSSYQAGVLSRAQALRAGMTGKQIDTAATQRPLAAAARRRVRDVHRRARARPPCSGPPCYGLGRRPCSAITRPPNYTGLVGHARPGHPRHGAQPVSQIAPIPGVILHYSSPRDAGRAIPSLRPPQTRVEETVLDLASGAASLDEALGWMFRACGSRQDHAGPNRRRHGPAGPDAVADRARGGARPRCAGGSLAAGVPVRQPGGAAARAAGRCRGSTG